MENKLIADRWKNIKKPKVLIATITSEANAHCQSQWLGRVLFLHEHYDVVIFENSDTEDNYNRLKSTVHNFSNIMIKRGKIGQKFIMNRIIDNRNLVLKYIRKHKEYDYIMMLDSDIFPPPSVISAFFKNRKKMDIQCALCFVTINGSDKTPALNFFKEDIESGKAMEYIQTRKPDTVKIAQNGMGCVFINADILRKYKSLKFYNKIIKNKRGKKLMNEDLTFTENLRLKGYDLNLHLNLECSHLMKN